MSQKTFPPQTTLPPTPNLFPTSFTGPAYQVGTKGVFTPVDPNAIEQLQIEQDIQGYDLAKQDWIRRFPELNLGSEAGIQSAATNLSGETDPQVQGALNQAGLGNVSFGHGEYQQARNLGMPILAKEQRDRTYFQRKLADNPQKAYGLSGDDIAHIAELNANGVAIAQNNAYGSKLNQYLASVAQASQNNAALIGGIGGILGTGIKAGASTYGSDPYLAGREYNSAVNQFGQGNVGYNAAGAAGTYNSSGQFTEAAQSGGW